MISSLSEKPLGQETKDKRVTQWIKHLPCHNFLEHPVLQKTENFPPFERVVSLCKKTKFSEKRNP
jgi:hypothetical protein